MRLLLALLFALTAAAQEFPKAPPSVGPERPLRLPQRHERKLSNGLLVVVAERHTSPRIAATLTFRSGMAVDPNGLEGISDFTAELMRRGTATLNSRQIAEELDAMGADLSVVTNPDSVAFQGLSLAENTERYLRLLADIISNPSFPPEELELHRTNQLQALLQQRAQPGFLASERFNRAVFGDHPYARFSPSEDSLKAIRRERLVQFHRQQFVPSNAFLLIVGDVQPEAAFKIAESAFASWRGGRAASPAWVAAPKRPGRRIYFVHRPGSVQSAIAVGNLSIRRADPDYFAVTIANTIFGGAFASRLVMNIREQKGYTYSPGSSVTAQANSGMLRVNASVRNEVTAATLTEIFYELDRLRTTPVTPKELQDAKNYYKGVFSLQLASLSGLRGALNSVYLYDLPRDYLETARERAQAVTAADVMRAARRHFDSPYSAIIVVGDLTKVREDVELFGPIEAYDVQGKPLEQ